MGFASTGLPAPTIPLFQRISALKCLSCQVKIQDKWYEVVTKCHKVVDKLKTLWKSYGDEKLSTVVRKRCCRRWIKRNLRERRFVPYVHGRV